MPDPRRKLDSSKNWKAVFGDEQGKGGDKEIPLTPVKARYVKLWCPEQDQGLPEGIVLNEFEVYGTGGPVIKPVPLPPPTKDGTWNLCGGWRLAAKRYVADDAAKIAVGGYNDSQWLPATVPGTILTSY